MIDVADSNKKYYYHFDGLGSVIALLDSSANVVERYSYDVFGDPNRTSDVNNPYYFTARRYDTETGLYYYRVRYYNPDFGRFMQVEPVATLIPVALAGKSTIGRFLRTDSAGRFLWTMKEGFPDELNLYTYVKNNPITYTDPFGLIPCREFCDRIYRIDVFICGEIFWIDCLTGNPLGGIVKWILCMEKSRANHTVCYADCVGK